MLFFWFLWSGDCCCWGFVFIFVRDRASLYKLGWPHTRESTSLCFPNNKNKLYHTWLFFFFKQQLYFKQTLFWHWLLKCLLSQNLLQLILLNLVLPALSLLQLSSMFGGSDGSREFQSCGLFRTLSRSLVSLRAGEFPSGSAQERCCIPGVGLGCACYNTCNKLPQKTVTSHVYPNTRID